MKYLLLIHQGTTPTPRDPEAWSKLSEDEQNAVFADYKAINETPGVTPGDRLHPPETATTVRVQDGKTLTTDGPFVETQGGDRRLLLLRGRRPRRRDRARGADPRGPASAARSRSVRSWSGSRPRQRLPRPVGPRPRCADRLPRRLRPRRGSHAGGVRDRGGALAARRDARQPRCVAGGDGAQPRDRPHSPRSHAGREDPPARGARGGGGHDGRDDLPRRAARARLHLLPSGPGHRGAGRADTADARRADDDRDRARVPGRRADDGPAAGAGQAQDQGRRDPVPRAARPPAARPPRRRARGRLPDLQRGLRRARRPGGRGDPARPRARRADARRARGARAAGDDAAA